MVTTSSREPGRWASMRGLAPGLEGITGRLRLQVAGVDIGVLKVDGGAVANNFLMQFQSDILGVPVDRPKVTETTAIGAAFLAGLAVGFWKDKAEIAAKWNVDHTFQPNMSAEARDKKYHGWKKAVERSRQWEENDH